MLANNKRFVNQSKMIRISGIKGVDTLISVYNDDGIKVAALFDNQMAYTYELAVALKLAELSVNDGSKFTYNVRLNSIQMDDMPGVTLERAADGTITSLNIVKQDTPANFENLSNPTDFWEEYTLVKK